MKTITICEPYATLIVRGLKWVENRTWPTSHRGPILIHAGKSRDWLTEDNYGIPLNELTFGAILGVANLWTCRQRTEIERLASNPAQAGHWKDWAEHEHTKGPWCWCLIDVKKFLSPIPYKGAQGLFDIPGEIVDEQIQRLSKP